MVKDRETIPSRCLKELGVFSQEIQRRSRAGGVCVQSSFCVTGGAGTDFTAVTLIIALNCVPAFGPGTACSNSFSLHNVPRP